MDMLSQLALMYGLPAAPMAPGVGHGRVPEPQPIPAPQAPGPAPGPAFSGRFPPPGIPAAPPLPPGGGIEELFPADPIRPAGVPGPGEPSLVAPPDAELSPPMLQRRPAAPPAATPPPELGTRPAVPASMLDGFREMFLNGDDSGLPSGEAQGGFGGFIRDAAAGMANVNSRAAPAAAFGAGLSSALGSADARSAAASKQRSDAEDKAWERKRDMLDIGVKLSGEERAAESHTDSRKKSKLDLATGAVDLQKKMLDAQYGGEEHLKLKQSITDDLNSWMDWWSEKNQFATPAEVNAEAERKRKELEEYYAPKGPAPATPTPAPEGGSEVPTSKAPAGGDGSSADKPTVFKPGGDVMAAFKALPSGAYYVNPKDGRVYRKK